MDAKLHPLRFQPLYKDYLWGGNAFSTLLGRPLPPGERYAESWEIADHGEAQSTVLYGPLRGTTLGELMAARPADIVGQPNASLRRFPLLLKYLDARERLSVQVHPSDAQAAAMGLADGGKTEAWVVLAAGAGSRIWAGLKEPTAPAVLRQAIAAGELEKHLHSFQPRQGDCLLVPAGTIHALGEGLLVAEVQQTSNATFRLFDWNRVGPDGRPRQLHVDQGLQALDPEQGPLSPQLPQPASAAGVDRLVSCAYFVLDRRRIDRPCHIGGDSRFHLLTVLGGEFTLDGDEGGPLRRGDTVLLPAQIPPVRAVPGGDTVPVLLDAYLS